MKHSWCTGVVSHSYDGLGGVGMVVVVGMHAGQGRTGWLHFHEMPEHYPCAT